MKANSTQVGGTHYQSDGLQHWDFISMHGVGYLEGCATKYVSRWRKKNGLVDLYKAAHYIEKMHELAKVEGRRPDWEITPGTLQQFLTDNNIPHDDARVILCILVWDTPADIKTAGKLLAGLIAQHTPGSPEDGGHHA
jgi:Protein of unknwon function (DUF3310)